METKSIKELEKIKNIISIIINILEENINSITKDGNINQEQQEILQFLIGSKESVISTITKLSNLLLKFNISESDCNTKIEDIDLDIIKRYLQK